MNPRNYLKLDEKITPQHDFHCYVYRLNTRSFVTWPIKGVGEGGGAGGARASPLSKVGGGTSGFVPPPPLLGRANVLISLFAHILWLKTQFFFKIFLARFARQL